MACRRMLLAVLVPLLVVPGPRSQAQTPSFESCRRQVHLLYDAPPVSTLPVKERSGIIHLLLPDLKASEGKMGFDTQDLTPRRLASMLRFQVLGTARSSERIVSVTYQDSPQCGNHGQCPAYLLGVRARGVRSLVPPRAGVGLSVGGAWGAAVFSRQQSSYPDLLFLATISASEVAVACYRWEAGAYTANCEVPCSQPLAHPDQ